MSSLTLDQPKRSEELKRNQPVFGFHFCFEGEFSGGEVRKVWLLLNTPNDQRIFLRGQVIGR